MFSGNAASKDSSLFEDPREFKPDRWNKDASKKIHPFSSLPFGFGPRSCYGNNNFQCATQALLRAPDSYPLSAYPHWPIIGKQEARQIIEISVCLYNLDAISSVFDYHKQMVELSGKIERALLLGPLHYTYALWQGFWCFQQFLPCM